MSTIESNTSEQSKIIPAHSNRLPNVLVGIPAYNEEVAIGSTVLSAKKLAANVLVVDDGSTDSTAEIARKAGATVISHETNRGKGAAIQTIFSRFQDGEFDAVVLLDGDGQHMPRDIPDVAKPVLRGECDMAIGSRYLDQKRTETPLYRRLGQKILDYVTAGSAGLTVSDSQSGFRALSPAAVEKLSLRTDGFGVESEMISEATDSNLDIEEVPIDVKYEEVDGSTYNPVHHGFAVLLFVLQLIRKRHPMMFFGIPGLFMLFFGGAVVVHGAMFSQSSEALSQWQTLVAGFIIFVGTLSLFSGLVLNQISNMIENVG